MGWVFAFHKWYDKQRDLFRLALLLLLCSPLFIVSIAAESIHGVARMLALIGVMLWMLFLLVSRSLFIARYGAEKQKRPSGANTGASA